MFCGVRATDHSGLKGNRRAVATRPARGKSTRERFVPHRAPGYNLLIPSVWLDPATTDENIAWTRETYAALEPDRAEGRWLNYYGDDEDPAELEAAYGPNRARLGEVKRRYDPDYVFHHNQNIVPAVVPA